MGDAKKPLAIVLDRDKNLADLISATLKEELFEVVTTADTEETLDLLKQKLFSLAVVGDPEGDETAFDAMKKVVMKSPMTSMILITDLSEEIVEEKAEGYGILGHIARDFSSEGLKGLIENFREIFKAMSSS